MPNTPNSESKQRLQALLKALPVGITFSTDATCDYITGNPYLLKKLEVAEGDNISQSTLENNIKGQQLRHFSGGKLLSGDEMPMQRAIAEKRQIEPMEIEVELPSGKRWAMEAIGAPVLDEKGNVVASVAVNIDLTDRKRAEEASRLELLIQEEKRKIDFISDAAHELRTPLAIIRGNVDLALREKNPTQAYLKETFEAINLEVMNLTNLLSDLSLITNKGVGFQHKVKHSEIDLKRLLAHIVKRHVGLAKKKDISIRAELPDDLNMEGDESYLKKLFSNIVSNAVSYGKEKGRIIVTGRKKGNSIIVEIEDDGIGISSKDQPLIFDRFYRAESSRSKDYGGTGLGLALVKWIAEAHGGSVKVKSALGKGSTFTVTLPLSQ